MVKVKEMESSPSGPLAVSKFGGSSWSVRMLSEESCIGIVGSRGQLRSHPSTIQSHPGSWAGFGTVGERMGWRSALLV